MPFRHIHFQLSPKPRGFHLVTREIMQHVGTLPASDGILMLFIQHTSAGLTINENADSDVRWDYETYFNRIVPENLPELKHTLEGPDDMPAHVKSTLTGHQLTIPFSKGQLLLGVWQGVYLCEFRNSAGGRYLTATICT